MHSSCCARLQDSSSRLWFGGVIKLAVYRNIGLGREVYLVIESTLCVDMGVVANIGYAGLNIGRGQEVLIRLRRYHDETVFFSVESCVDSMLHE